MSSLEEDELVRMVQDFIESEPTSPTISTSSNSHALHHPTQYLILQEIVRSDEGDKIAEAKVLKCVMKHMRQSGAEKTRRSNNLNRLLVTRLKMDGIHASLCQTSWSTSFGYPAGEYEYIEVMIEDEKYCNPKRMIVDIDFRSQFELAKPTEQYRELTELLPVIFVGTEEKLCKIITLLCSAAKQSLREKGLHVPPWRTTGYMQSKWLSKCSKDSEQTENDRENCMMTRKNEIIGKWMPPNANSSLKLKPKKRELGSGLSSQFSKMSINCC